MKTTQAQYTVNGGVHPAYHKAATADKAIEEMPVPASLEVSMLQHLGAPAEPVVEKGATVKRGDCIGRPMGFISAAVHAPTSGTVKAIDTAPTPSGTMAAAVTIEPDGEDAWTDALAPLPDWRGADSKKLIRVVADAGITGMGGAGFPTHVKLSPPPDKPIETLLINGAECEPYLTADARLMIEQAEAIAEGIAIIQRILDVTTVRVAIEDNKPDAITAMSKALEACEGDAAVVVLPTKYPQGAEKQQICAATGKEVPSGGLPMDVGALVENVSTTLAIRTAVVNGQPLTERVTTVTGQPVKRPANVLARLGTSYADLLAFCDNTEGTVAKVVSGGPMMGFAQHGLAVSTTKTTSGLLFLAPDQVHTFSSMPCIGCGRCVNACPMYLMPSELSFMIEAEDIDEAEELNVMDCIECGCCAFACPAHRPLVQHMKQAKAHIARKRRAARAART